MSIEPTHFQQVMSDYEFLEPGASDSWSPVGNPNELSYRLMLYYSAVRSLEHGRLDRETADVLDIGCGNGRSTRMYVDLGFSPERVTGVDLRPGAIASAQRLNPAINFEHADGFPLSRFDPVQWVSLSTVASSVECASERKALMLEAWRHVAPGGFLFYFDRVRANTFAGGDKINPRRFLPDAEVVWHRRFRLHDMLPFRAALRGLVMASGTTPVRRVRAACSLAIRPSHEVLLFTR